MSGIPIFHYNILKKQREAGIGLFFKSDRMNRIFDKKGQKTPISVLIFKVKL